MQNKLNINDWSSVQSLFDKLNKQMEKTLKAADSLGAPRVYIKMLVELEVRLPFCPCLEPGLLLGGASRTAHAYLGICSVVLVPFPVAMHTQKSLLRQRCRAESLVLLLKMLPAHSHLCTPVRVARQPGHSCALSVQDRLYATLANKELTKKMSPTNAKALNTMRQRLRKHNPQYAEQMEKFRANPESEEEPDRCFLTSSWLGQAHRAACRPDRYM